MRCRYSCDKSDRFYGSRRNVSSPLIRRSIGSRCTTCARNHQGGCGTAEAYKKCERKPDNWVGKPPTPRRTRPSGPSRPRHQARNLSSMQPRIPFFIQFIWTLQPNDRELAKTFWGQGVALCDAKRQTPQDPWELLATPLRELQACLGNEDGKRIHASAMAFASGGVDEARLLATVRRKPKELTIKTMVNKHGAPEALARWIRRLYHVLRVAGQSH